MQTIKLDCPAKDCKVTVFAEINTSVVPKEEREKLMADAREHLLKSTQKHHDDGHPNGPSYAETELGKKK